MNERHSSPDPHALALASAIQEMRPKDTVYLCGSRAVGDYRADSDIDLFVVAEGKTNRWDTEEAAQKWFKEHPPDLYVSSLEMERSKFLRFIKVSQSFAGQAARHGIPMKSETLNWPDYLSPDDPELRETLGMWLRMTTGHIDDLQIFRERYFRWTFMIGQEAGWAIERGIKALLTALNDPVRFRHDFTAMWQHLLNTLDWNAKERSELRQAMDRVLSLTDCDDPEQPDGRGNLLVQYTHDYRVDRVDRKYKDIGESERTDIIDAATLTAQLLCQEARRTVNLTDHLSFP